jgi:hypothetical protein
MDVLIVLSFIGIGGRVRFHWARNLVYRPMVGLGMSGLIRLSSRQGEGPCLSNAVIKSEQRFSNRL